MFNSDADHGAMGGNGAYAASPCVASDLKSILNSIADQIAAADERHTRSLAQMHQRLDQFRAEAGQARDGAPEPASAGYDRVEQRIQDLAARLSAGSARDRADPAPVLAARGTNAGGMFGGRLETQADTFDVVGEAPAEDPDSPWDRNAAEALASVYTPQLADGSDDQMAIASPVLMQIEDRFADIASRIEQYVHDLRPVQQFDELDQRFDRLEQRLDSVLTQTTSPASVESLHSLELQLDDMARQIEAAQNHFSRLDVIETEIRALADRVAEDRLADVFRRNAPEQPDVADLAAMIASQMSETLGAGVRSGSTQDLDELRGLIQSFAEEQRHGDEQTATMLDTMQQAMIRLLDRMDSLETNQFALAQPQAMALQPASVEPAPRAQMSERELLAAAFDTETQPPLHYGQGHRPHDEHGRSQAIAPEQITAAVQAHQGARAQQAAPAQPAPPAVEPAQPQPARAAPAQPDRDVEPTDPVAKARKNLMDSARRARETAGGDAGKLRLRVDPSESAAEHIVVAKAGKPKGGIKLSPLSMALVALIALGAGFSAVSMMQGRSAGSTPAATATVKQSDVRPSNAETGLERDANNAAPRAFEQQRRAAMEPRGDAGQIIGPGEPAPAPQPSFAMPPAAADTPFTTAALQTGIAPGQGRVVAPPSLTEAAMPPVSVGPNSLRLAAAQGDASAQFEVASRLAEGKGVQQDFAAAVVWYEKAAAQGFVLAQYRLGTHYERGLGVKADLDRAIDFYRKAAEQGNVKSMYNLAVLSTARQNPGPDYASAVTWFSQAASYGLVDSQFNLAVLYDSGVGVTRDAKAAYKWFSIAANAGDADSAKRRDALKAKLSKEQVRAADAEVAVWRAVSPDPVGNDPRAAGEIWKRRSAGQATSN